MTIYRVLEQETTKEIFELVIDTERELIKLQEQNKELVELLKEADSVIDDYINWRNEKRMDYFDARAMKLRKEISKVTKMRTIKSKRIFYKPTFADKVMNNWHKILIISLLLMLVGKILAHGFKIAA